MTGSFLVMNNIPSEKQWRGGFFERWFYRLIYDIHRANLGIDGETAYKHFFGKSHSAAVEMFRDDSLSRQEDLMWMPFSCFRFYINAYIEYLMSDSSRGDSCGANAFFGLIIFWLPELKILNDSEMSTIRKTIEFIGQNQDYFGAELEVYGSFPLKSKECLAKIS